MPFRDLIVGGLLVLGVVAGNVACASRAGDATGTGGAAARNGAGGAAVTTGGAAGSSAASVSAGGTSLASGGTAAFDLCPPGLVGAKSSATGGLPATLSGCGDGILLYKFEGCDDGNLQSGDGCSSNCTIEPGWTCDRPGQPCRLPTCGNGLIETPETCDDFNTIGGDGCSAQCTVENGWTCEHSGLVVPNCYHARCGDGRVNSLPYVDAAGRSLQETCDDGNTQSGDGCSSTCAIEDGWVCTRPTGIGQHPGPLSLTYVIEDFMPPCLKISCGDGFVEASEQCDDKNTVSGDGCSATCEIEPDFYCATPGQPCVAVVCGDGVIVPPESCDDGNALPGDGCNQACQLEPGSLICDPPGQLCHATVCGDGKAFAPEECDDGNTQSGDGCTADCKLEPGMTCVPEGGPCHLVRCGDGLLDPGEAYYEDAGVFQSDMCDDGNAQSGDGCSSSCLIESGFTCDTPGAPCRLPTCGNGRYEAPEGCDDGNTRSGDGCSANCTLEPGYDCSQLGAACLALCGNAKLETFGTPCGSWFEECDDGNVQAGDGCSPNCKLEPGWQCGVPAKPCWRM